MPPVDTEYIAGRWHKDRVTLKGYGLEARVFAKSLVTPRNLNKRFLVIGRARSGTSLLTKLLNQHSEIQCDGEVLQKKVIAPAILLDRLAGKSRAPAYGAKLLSYQMVQTYRIRDPNRFLDGIASRGFVLIHLTRNTFFQTLSLMVAQMRWQFHSDTGATRLTDPIHLDPEDFVNRIEWNEALLDYENAAFSGLDHLLIRYEIDLAGPAEQLRTLDSICGKLGVAPENVAIPLEKVLPTDPKHIIANYDEVVTRLEARGFGNLVP
jgi:LPS sulfotransferase NodH